MRIPAARISKLPASQRRPLPGYVHQRPGARPITSQAAPSIQRNRPNSTLAVQDSSSVDVDNAIFHAVPASQPHPSFPSPFAPKGRICNAIERVECSSYLPATVLTPLEQYHRLVDSGTLRADDHQTRIIGKLQRLHDDLLHYQPPPVPGAAPSLSLVCTWVIFRPLLYLDIILLVLAFVFFRTCTESRHTGANAQGALPIWRCGHRKDDAHGSLLHLPPSEHHSKASRALPRVHDRRSQTDTRRQEETWAWWW